MQTKKIKESSKSYFISYAENVNLSKNGDETAIVIDNNYFILNGNWIEKYKKCKNKKEQLKLFIKNYKLHGGFWTDDVEIAKKLLTK